MDAERARLWANGEDVQELGQPGVAVFLDELGLAAKSAAGLALDREGRDAEVRERVGVAHRR